MTSEVRNLTNSGVVLTKEMATENRPSAEEDTSSTTEYKKRIEIIEPSTRGTSTDSAGDADAFAPPKETLKERRNTARITPVVCDIRLAEESEPEFIKELKKLASEKVTGRDILVIGGIRSSRDLGRAEPEKQPKLEKVRKSIREKRWVPKLINPLCLELTKQQMKDLQDAFDLLEDPKTGMVRICDVETVIRACGSDPKPEVMANILERVKPTYPGYFTFDEFVRSFKSMLDQEDSVGQVQKAFKLMDDADTGRVTLEDLRRVSNLVGYGLNTEELKDILDDADSDSEGGVTMDKFVRLMTKKQYYDC